MTNATLATLTEDELDTLVSIAILRAESLEDAGAPTAKDAWYEVMLYEQQLANLTSAEDVPGGIARVGAVRAAVAAGQFEAARILASTYLQEPELPAERKAAIEDVLSAIGRMRSAEEIPPLARTPRLR